jgi:galactosylceramidase
MNNLYVKGRITQMQIWCPVDACDDGALYGGVGAMQADQPWSGHYATRPATWCLAHYTQFTKPGWLFLDCACGQLSGKGNYAALKAPDSDHWSLIIYAEKPERLLINLAPGLATGPIHVWRSNKNLQFIPTTDITPTNGRFHLLCARDSLCSLTTTTGQQKAQPPHTIPAPAAFPFPYDQDFESCDLGQTPPFISDMQGTWLVASCLADRSGKCLQQILPKIGEPWAFDWVNPPTCMTIFGSTAWANYTVAADFLLQNGEIYLAIRKGPDQKHCGYALVVNKAGQWRLALDNVTDPKTTLASGQLPDFHPDAWHNLKLRASGPRIQAFLDNAPLCAIINNTYKKGQPALGSTFDLNQFDNLKVTAISK